MRKYCDPCTSVDINTSPLQTMGNLSNAQKGLKRFLTHRLKSRCNDHKKIDRILHTGITMVKGYRLQNAIQLKKDTLIIETMVGTDAL